MFRAAFLPAHSLRDGGALLIAVDPQGRVSLATAQQESAPGCFANAKAVQWGLIDRDLPAKPAGANVSLRVLYRRDMVEAYLDDYLFPVYLMPPSRGRIAVLPAASALVTNVRRWNMSLPGDASWEPGAGADEEWRRNAWRPGRARS